MEEPQYPCPKCGSESEILEYEKDEDIYVAKCQSDDCGERWAYETDDEVWK